MQMYYKVVLQGSIQGDQIVKEPEIQNVSATHKKIRKQLSVVPISCCNVYHN